MHLRSIKTVRSFSVSLSMFGHYQKNTWFNRTKLQTKRSVSERVLPYVTMIQGSSIQEIREVTFSNNPLIINIKWGLLTQGGIYSSKVFANILEDVQCKGQIEEDFPIGVRVLRVPICRKHYASYIKSQYTSKFPEWVP